MSSIKTIKLQLLQETNYRCGYCMKNITPKMYYIDEEQTNPKPVFDYQYYNIHDRAHIEPNSEVDDDFKDFYNLIALCKQCHWEIDKTKMLTTTELKRQKLYWMIASGRFTRLEVDLLMKLYSNTKIAQERGAYDKIIKPCITRITEINGEIFSPTQGTGTFHSHNIEIFPTNLLTLIPNIRKNNFCDFNPKIPGLIHVSFTQPGTAQFVNHEIMINQSGWNFCKKFSDVYQDL